MKDIFSQRKGGVAMTSADDTMSATEQLGQPFLFWLIGEMFSEEQSQEEEIKPIGDREFYAWLTLIGGALMMYAVVFRLLAVMS